MSNRPSFWAFTKQSVRSATIDYFEPLVALSDALHAKAVISAESQPTTAHPPSPNGAEVSSALSPRPYVSGITEANFHEIDRKEEPTSREIQEIVRVGRREIAIEERVPLEEEDGWTVRVDAPDEPSSRRNPQNR